MKLGISLEHLPWRQGTTAVMTNMALGPWSPASAARIVYPFHWSPYVMQVKEQLLWGGDITEEGITLEQGEIKPFLPLLSQQCQILLSLIISGGSCVIPKGFCNKKDHYKTSRYLKSLWTYEEGRGSHRRAVCLLCRLHSSGCSLEKCGGQASHSWPGALGHRIPLPALRNIDRNDKESNSSIYS